jgi:hypothetical protein
MRWALRLCCWVRRLHRLLRGHRHPRYGGMRVSARELVIWSFLMATAHGAGLMVLPFLPANRTAVHDGHAATCTRCTQATVRRTLRRRLRQGLRWTAWPPLATRCTAR